MACLNAIKTHQSLIKKGFVKLEGDHHFYVYYHNLVQKQVIRFSIELINFDIYSAYFPELINMKRLKSILCVSAVLLLALFEFGCAQKGSSNKSKLSMPANVITDTPTIHNVDSTILHKSNLSLKPNRLKTKTGKWFDSLKEKYTLESKNELVRAAVSDKLSEEWLFDQVIETDTAKYFVYAIGHDVSEKDGSDLRFITDQWVYVDSSRRLLYEFDVDNERLVRWSK